MEAVTDFIFLGSRITVDDDCSHEIQRHLLLGRKSMTNLDSTLKKQRHHFANKGACSQNYGFSSSHVRMWMLEHKEVWALKNCCVWIVVLEKTLESPLDCKDIKSVNLKGNQPWILEGLMLKLKLQYFGYWFEELTHWKRPWCWEGLKAEREGCRGWDGYIASPIQWSGIWAYSRR